MKVYRGYRKPNGTCIIETRDENGTLIASIAGFDWLGINLHELTWMLLNDATGDIKLAEKYKFEFAKLVSALNPVEWEWSQKSILLSLKDIICSKQQPKAKYIPSQSYVSPTVVQQKYEQVLYEAGYRYLKDSSTIDKEKLMDKWDSKYHVFIKQNAKGYVHIALIKQRGDSKIYLSNRAVNDIADHAGWNALESIPELKTAIANGENDNEVKTSGM